MINRNEGFYYRQSVHQWIPAFVSMIQRLAWAGWIFMVRSRGILGSTESRFLESRMSYSWFICTLWWFVGMKNPRGCTEDAAGIHKHGVCLFRRTERFYIFMFIIYCLWKDWGSNLDLSSCQVTLLLSTLTTIFSSCHFKIVVFCGHSYDSEWNT